MTGTTRAARRHMQIVAADTLRARHIDRDDHELLTFSINWLPYGGAPDDEIMVRFGLTRKRYGVRLQRVVDDHCALIHPQTAMRLKEICRQCGGGSPG